ncbi:MAG: hypothetical protein ACYS5W_08325 [Planctomycetota bacterium]|jgi:hypothetical protein
MSSDRAGSSGNTNTRNASAIPSASRNEGRWSPCTTPCTRTRNAAVATACTTSDHPNTAPDTADSSRTSLAASSIRSR